MYSSRGDRSPQNATRRIDDPMKSTATQLVLKAIKIGRDADELLAELCLVKNDTGFNAKGGADVDEG